MRAIKDVNSFIANHNNNRGHLNRYNDSRFKFLNMLKQRVRHFQIPSSTGMPNLKSVVPEEKLVQVDSFPQCTLGVAPKVC